MLQVPSHYVLVICNSLLYTGSPKASPFAILQFLQLQKQNDRDFEQESRVVQSTAGAQSCKANRT